MGDHKKATGACRGDQDYSIIIIQSSAAQSLQHQTHACHPVPLGCRWRCCPGAPPCCQTSHAPRPGCTRSHKSESLRVLIIRFCIILCPASCTFYPATSSFCLATSSFCPATPRRHLSSVCVPGRIFMHHTWSPPFAIPYPAHPGNLTLMGSWVRRGGTSRQHRPHGQLGEEGGHIPPTSPSWAAG